MGRAEKMKEPVSYLEKVHICNEQNIAVCCIKDKKQPCTSTCISLYRPVRHMYINLPALFQKGMKFYSNVP